MTEQHILGFIWGFVTALMILNLVYLLQAYKTLKSARRETQVLKEMTADFAQELREMAEEDETKPAE